MLQAFVIVLREGFEAFLIVAIILAYLKKKGEHWLVPAVYWGIGLSVFVSAGAGWLLREGVNQALWEGVLATITVVMVGSLVVHMWRFGAQMKLEMEQHLSSHLSAGSKKAAFAGVLGFTVLMISREGMETAIMLIQVRQSGFVMGAVLGLVAVLAFCYAWVRLSYLINVKHFFQVTGIFLLLFLAQVALYAVHEFSEAGVLPSSDFVHELTELYSPNGLYGKWFSLATVAICGGWLIWAWIVDSVKPAKSRV